MFRKLFAEVKYHHLVRLFAILSVIFVTAGVFIYLEVPPGVRGRGFYLLLILLTAVLLWGILLVLVTHVAHRDGFWDGYQTGIRRVLKGAKKRT